MNGFLSYFYAIVVLLFIVALAYYSTRLVGKKAMGAVGNRYIRLVAALPLGQNKVLQVVVVDEKTVLLLGVGGDVECVARFEDPDLAQRMVAERDAGTPGLSTLGLPRIWEWVQNNRRRQGPQADFATILGQRLAEMKERRAKAYEDFAEEPQQDGSLDTVTPLAADRVSHRKEDPDGA